MTFDIAIYWIAVALAVIIYLLVKLLLGAWRDEVDLRDELQKSNDRNTGLKEQIKNLEAKVWELQKELLTKQN